MSRLKVKNCLECRIGRFLSTQCTRTAGKLRQVRASRSSRLGSSYRNVKCPTPAPAYSRPPKTVEKNAGNTRAANLTVTAPLHCRRSELDDVGDRRSAAGRSRFSLGLLRRSPARRRTGASPSIVHQPAHQEVPSEGDVARLVLPGRAGDRQKGSDVLFSDQATLSPFVNRT